ncbi:zinc-dependent alcohol dehydrogenase family protein [Crenobacter sp. SG2303]|uniref:Zinc-dependent alcohol dehydrogenase family protein n=1 Tax=Crenobacter oryzisoli TaxID=3056844 RepID=A0ABT7XIA3_9NEIS|nr:zinc-dependent alcohol dehydrogenase family protein [Crenobacter sp. SG2303]MDN0073518.1 zinc-dependent alcohol dehydrogenase family protein [Crenobacter sp. SG2303]
MRVMCCYAPKQDLLLEKWPDPTPQRGQLLIQVHACGVCRTDLHVIDGELTGALSPVIPGHEIVGHIVALGDDVTGFRLGERVGVPWLGHTCGTCRFCETKQENLCENARFHGFTLQGGYADYVVAEARYCFHLPDRYIDVEAAPLLCAGLIGYRALRFAQEANCLGIYGFGTAAHLVAQIACHQGREVYAFTRPGDREAQRFALSIGARWAGDSDTAPPKLLDAALLFAPVGSLVPTALSHLVAGGVVVCAGIHMTDIPAFPYRLLWGERQIRSVANLTRDDGLDFLRLAEQVPLQVHVTPYPLEHANHALFDLRCGRVQGAAVLTTF